MELKRPHHHKREENLRVSGMTILCMIMKCWRYMQCISIGNKRMYQVHKYTLTFEDLVEVLLDVLLSLLVAFATLAVFDDGVSYVS